MLYDPSTNAALQAWLVKTLEPICDAEPEALATYVIALLKHDVPEHDLREELIKQLDEFFENGANAFVDTLFAALRSKSYVPYTTGPSSFTLTNDASQDAGIPIPLDALMSPQTTSPTRGTKRVHDGDDRETRGPPKGPRLSNEAYFARQANGYGAESWNRRGDSMNGGMSQSPRIMLPKGVCRDYHLKGFCSRGAMCKFTHDEGAFFPQMPMQMDGSEMPFMGMYGPVPFPGGPLQTAGYDPNDPRMDMRQEGQYQRIPTMHRTQNGLDGTQMFHGHADPSVVQDLTPRPFNQPSSMDAKPPELTSAGHVGTTQTHSMPSAAPTSGGASFDSPSELVQSSRPQRLPRSGFRGRSRGGRGTFTGDHQSFERSENGRNSKTIVVEKIPDDKLMLGTINDWFSRYGTVTNVAVDAPGKKALVSFSSHEEARAAWSAEEAVFNNRFVKIFWHRPMEGQGIVGQRALQASASIVASMSSKENVPAQTTVETPKPTVVTVAAGANKPAAPKLTALQEKEKLLERQIAEQKELMAKLSSASPEEKKEVLARLRSLNAEMKTPPTGEHPPHSRTSSNGAENKERKAKELLDMELEAHSKTKDESSPAENGETRESLREQLEKLRAEASALGITDVSPQPYQQPYRGFRGRGRGRGRGAFRGRGGIPRSSMKLDNRPKALLVKGVATQDTEAVEAVRTWYEAGGQLVSLDVHDGESVIARFQSRPAAEQALAKGIDIPSVGAVKLSWHSDAPGLKPGPISTALDVSEKTVVASTDDQPSSPRVEETVEEMGWGHEDDDGMGMGMGNVY